jgi:hypothetical protein
MAAKIVKNPTLLRIILNFFRQLPTAHLRVPGSTTPG